MTRSINLQIDFWSADFVEAAVRKLGGSVMGLDACDPVTMSCKPAVKGYRCVDESCTHTEPIPDYRNGKEMSWEFQGEACSIILPPPARELNRNSLNRVHGPPRRPKKILRYVRCTAPVRQPARRFGAR